MDNTQYDQMNIELKKEIMHLLRHPETAWYGGVILLGKIELDDAVQTAYTDGFNVRIGTEFFASLTRGQRRLLIMHEMFHKAFMHLPYYKSYWKEDHKTANLACDHVVNNLCMSFKDPELCEPIPKMVWDVKYKGWSVPEIYRDLKQDEEEDEPQGGGDGEDSEQSGGEGEGGSSVDDGCMDEHDWDNQGDEGDGDEGEDGEGSGKANDKPSPSELERKVKEALQQGGILAGRLGVPVPREFHEVMEPKVDWREVLREFITAHTVGRDEGTWRKYNRRMLPLDYLYPSAIKETPTELIVAIDLSGSIDGRQLDAAIAELVSICNVSEPDKVRVLWWDTEVRSEQVFISGEYDRMAEMLKPVGGGGTHVGCVSAYVEEQKYRPDAVVVITDGYVEHDPRWEITAPTLWLVTENRSFTPPNGGQTVTIDKEV